MNNSVKIGLIGLSGFAIGFVIGRTIKKEINEKRNKKKNKVNQPKEEVKLKTRKPEVIEQFPLAVGSKGEKVKRLQVFLMRKLGMVRKPTGEFDEITLKRVQSWFKTDTISKSIYEKLKLDKMVHDQRKRRNNGNRK